MAVTAESVHSILMELGLPATIEDLRNPTETFIINIISEFLQRFHIDVATITKTTLEQNSALRVTNPDNANIASLINLREAMFVIGNKIFVKDFSIYDFTSPGPKRTRKHLKFIANFTLYARNTMECVRQRVDEVLIRGQYISDLRKKKQAIIEGSNKSASEIAKKKADIEKLRNEIEMTRARIEKRKIPIDKLNDECNILEQNKLQAIERNQAAHAEIKKLEEITRQLKGKIVDKPELIQERLQKLKDECNMKKEKRTTVQEMIENKKPMVQNLETAVAFVTKERARVLEVFALQNILKENNQECESLKSQIAEATDLITFETNRDHEGDDKLAYEKLKKCEACCEEKLLKLRNLYNDLMIKKKTSERKVASVNAHQFECCSERDGIHVRIIELENEIGQFLQQCQELYTKEIRDIETIHMNAENELEKMNK